MRRNKLAGRSSWPPNWPSIWRGKGIASVMCAVPNESAPVNPTTIQGVELWRYHAPAAGASHARSLIRHVQGAYRLTVEILRRSPVVCLNGHSPLQFLGASLAIGKNARQVYSVHSPFPDEIASNQRGRRRGIKQRAMVRVARMIESSNVRRADLVQGDSRFTAARLVELYGQPSERKIVVAPGWVDVERFQPAADVPAIRAGLDPLWQTSAPVFFTVRRLEARMGLEQLIEAAKLLRDQQQAFRLIIGGGAPGGQVEMFSPGLPLGRSGASPGPDFGRRIAALFRRRGLFRPADQGLGMLRFDRLGSLCLRHAGHRYSGRGHSRARRRAWI